MRERSMGLDWQNQSISINQSRVFVHLFAAVARLQRENAYFHVLSRTGTQKNNFLFLYVNFDTILSNCQHLTN